MSSDALAVAIRAGLYLDLMLLFGAAAFRFQALMADPAARRSRGAAAIVLAALTGIGLTLLGLAALAATMSGTTLATVEHDSIRLLVHDTAVGHAGFYRLLALLFAAFCGLFWGRRPFAATIGVLLGSSIALASLAWSGHGAMDEGLSGRIHLGADIVHLLAAAIWVGALAMLLRLALRRGPTDLRHLRRIHAALERFSAIGVAVVLLVAISGLANGWFLVGPDLAGLWQSGWGRLLLIKLALVLAMLALAAINRVRLTPRLAGAPDARAMRELRFSLFLETSAAVLILLLVAALGTLEPPISSL